jgi:hypothetical protein
MTLVSDPWQGLWVLDINTSYFTLFFSPFSKKKISNLIFQHLIYWKLIFELLPFAFLSTWLSQSYVHGCKINWLTQIDLNLFFFISSFEYFFFPIRSLDCLDIGYPNPISGLPWYHNRVVLVSQPDHKFSMLIYLGSGQFFLSFFIVSFIFVYLFYCHHIFLFHVIKIIWSY